MNDTVANECIVVSLGEQNNNQLSMESKLQDKKLENRKNTKRILFISITVSLVVLVILSAVFIFYLVEKESNEVCLTPICIAIAAEIMKRIDQTVDPCDDFYRFSCGGLDNKMNAIPEDRAILSVTSNLNMEIDNRIRVLLEDIKETDSGHYLTKMKLLYKKCMNYRSREDLGNEPLISLLSKIGGWPVIQGSGWNSDNFSLEETLITMRQTGVHHTLFSLYIDNEGWEEKDNHIVIDYPNLVSDDLDYTDNETMIAYLDYVTASAVELGADKRTARKELENVIEFEQELSKLIKAFPFSNENWVRVSHSNLSVMDENFHTNRM